MGKKLNYILAVLVLLVGANYLFGLEFFLLSSYVSIGILGIMVASVLFTFKELGFIRWPLLLWAVGMIVILIYGDITSGIGSADLLIINMLGLNVDVMGLLFIALGIFFLIVNIRHKPFARVTGDYSRGFG